MYLHPLRYNIVGNPIYLMVSHPLDTSLPSTAELPCSDDTPVGNEDQNLLPNLLLFSLALLWSNRRDWFFGVDMAVYHTTGISPKVPVVPNAFLSLGVERKKAGKSRRSYATWEENDIAPILVLEMVSHRPNDECDEKLEIYARLGVLYYVIYNPEFWQRDRHQPFEIYRLEGETYHLKIGEPYWIPEIGLGLGRGRQTIAGIEQEVLLWHNAEGQAYPMPEQRIQDMQSQLIAERQQAEAERRRAERLATYLRSILYVTPRGLTTAAIPYKTRSFQMSFDFLNHHLQIDTSDGMTQHIALAPRTVADFYQTVMTTLSEMGIEVRIWTMPQEIAEPIPFEQDDQHAAYDPESAQRFWRILLQVDRVMTLFRSRFIGKSSPVHFFWGSFDLAVTRFSGRRAPDHPGGVPNMADWVTREAYSHEVSSCGFWPGGGSVVEPVFYAYAYPAPDGFREYPIQPQAAFYSAEMQEFILPYESVRQTGDPDAMLLAFFQSTYEAAANLGHWDRATLERP